MSLSQSLRLKYWRARTAVRNLRPPYTLRAAIRYAELHVSLLHNRVGKASVGQPHLALFAWLFPPLISGGVYRPTALVRYGASAGWRATVITGPAPEEPSAAGNYLLRQIPDSVAIVRVPKCYQRTAFWFPSVDDAFMHGVEGYFKAIALLDQEPPAVVMASGPPFHSFVAAYYTARRYGAPLVLEFRDEWTQTPFDFIKLGNADQRWEERCLRHADLVIFTTDSQRQHLMQFYPFLDGAKCAVVANGWEPDDFADAPFIGQRRPATPITLAYLGNLGAMASPDNFFDTLADALAANPYLRGWLKLKLVGQKRPDALAKLRAFPFPDVIELIDPIPKADACNMMCDVDGLLLLNPTGLKRYIQGKLYEYIASGTPVLVFGTGGEIGHVITELDAGPVIAENDAGILSHAIESISSWDMQAKREMRDEWLARHTREVLSGQLLELLSQLAAKSPAAPLGIHEGARNVPPNGTQSQSGERPTYG